MPRAVKGGPSPRARFGSRLCGAFKGGPEWIVIVWPLLYLLVILSHYAIYSEQGNPVFCIDTDSRGNPVTCFNTDSVDWVNGAMEGHKERASMYILFRHIMPRLFADNWTAYLLMMCFVLWMSGCLAYYVCSRLADRFASRQRLPAFARSIPGGVAGLLFVAHDTTSLLLVTYFVYIVICFLSLTLLLALFAYQRTAKIRYWAGLLIIYAIAVNTHSFSFLFPLVLFSIEVSTRMAKPGARHLLGIVVRYIPLLILSAWQVTESIRPGADRDPSLPFLISLDTVHGYVSYVTGSVYQFLFITGIDPEFRIKGGVEQIIALAILVAVIGYIYALRRPASSSALPVILIVFWQLCSFVPLWVGAWRNYLGVIRSNYTALGIALFCGVILSLILLFLYRRLPSVFIKPCCAAVTGILIASIFAARPSVPAGLLKAFSRPLRTFPGCQNRLQCAGYRRMSAPGSKTPDGFPLAPCGDASQLKLSGDDLAGIDLHLARLVRTTFLHTNLSRANLSRTCAALITIEDSNCSHFSLADADLSAAKVVRSNLSYANLDRAQMKGSNMQNVIARYASLQNADIRLSAWGHCDLRYSNLDGADLSGSPIWGTTMAGASLRRANLSGATAPAIDFSRSMLDGANLTGVGLQWANFSGASLRGTIFTEANLSGAFLVGARLANNKMQGAQLHGAMVCQRDLVHLKGIVGTPVPLPCPGLPAGGVPWSASSSPE